MFCPNPECPVLRETGEPAEYREGVTHCRDCGTALVELKPELDSVSHEAFVPVREIGNAALIPIARSLLSSADILFFIKNEGLQDLFGWGRLGTGFSYVTGPPVVYVEPDRAEEARELLKELGEPTDLEDEESS